jgi:DNA topoisomerase VI subunit B
VSELFLPSSDAYAARGSRQQLRPVQREVYRTSRLLDFASRRELTAQIGHQPQQWPQVAVKELIDNALDACEEAGVAPRIEVDIDGTGISLVDNGPGIAADVVKDILDFSIRVSSREAYVGPTRGAQGNALKTVIAMPFALDGEAGRVVIESCGVRHEIAFSVDRIAQEPRALHRRSPSPIKTGTAVTLGWPDSSSSILLGSMPSIRRDLYKFATFNPHLHLTVRLGHECEVYEPTDLAWKRWRPSDPPPAQWYDLDRFERLVAAKIQHDRQLGRVRTVRELIAEFRGLTAMAKQKKLLAELGMARTSLEALVIDGRLDRDQLDRLLKAMQTESRPVHATALGVIGKDHLLARLPLTDLGRESFTYRKRVNDDPGNPRVAETAFAFDEEAFSGRLLLIGLNNSAALSEAGAFRELGVDGLGGLLGRQYAGSDAPIAFVLHLTGARLSFTDRGKSAVAL